MGDPAEGVAASDSDTEGEKVWDLDWSAVGARPDGELEAASKEEDAAVSGDEPPTKLQAPLQMPVVSHVPPPLVAVEEEEDPAAFINDFRSKMKHVHRPSIDHKALKEYAAETSAAAENGPSQGS